MAPPLAKAIDDATGCPLGEANEIVVCRRTSPSERYRIPLALRPDGFDFTQDEIDSVSRERNRLLEGGEIGIGSCSTSGPGGAGGCLIRQFRAAKEQRAGH